MALGRIEHNNHMAHFETGLLKLAKGGCLVNCTQFKHVIFAPQAWSGYDEAFFPGVRDALDVGGWRLAQDQVQEVAQFLEQAARTLSAPVE